MSSLYRLEVSPGTRRQLQRLPERVAVAVVEFMTTVLPDNPDRMSKLPGELEEYRSARRGDYRILIRVDATGRVVLVVRVAHRADVYRPRTP